jgi:hypothetical protein
MSLVCLSSLSSVFSDAKFEQDHVRRALRQSGGREDRAVNLLLEVTATSDAQFSCFYFIYAILLSSKGLLADAVDEPPQEQPER